MRIGNRRDYFREGGTLGFLENLIPASRESFTIAIRSYNQQVGVGMSRLIRILKKSCVGSKRTASAGVQDAAFQVVRSDAFLGRNSLEERWNNCFLTDIF